MVNLALLKWGSDSDPNGNNKPFLNFNTKYKLLLKRVTHKSILTKFLIIPVFSNLFTFDDQIVLRWVSGLSQYNSSWLTKAQYNWMLMFDGLTKNEKQNFQPYNPLKTNFDRIYINLETVSWFYHKCHTFLYNFHYMVIV